MEDFISKTENLLTLERKAEVEQCEELLSAQIIQDSKRLETKGLCITKLSVSHQRIGLYGRSIVTFTRGNKKSSAKDLPSSHFTTGNEWYNINYINYTILDFMSMCGTYICTVGSSTVIFIKFDLLVIVMSVISFKILVHTVQCKTLTFKT